MLTENRLPAEGSTNVEVYSRIQRLLNKVTLQLHQSLLRMSTTFSAMANSVTIKGLIDLIWLIAYGG